MAKEKLSKPVEEISEIDTVESKPDVKKSKVQKDTELPELTAEQVRLMSHQAVADYYKGK